MHSWQKVCCIVALGMAPATGPSADTAIEPLAGTNLASGKSATFSLEPSYGMVYATRHGPITSKRREARREGIEDVELWRHLGTVAAKTGDASLAQLHREGPARLVNRQDGRADLGQVDLHSGPSEELLEMRLEVLKAVAEALKK